MVNNFLLSSSLEFCPAKNANFACSFRSLKILCSLEKALGDSQKQPSDFSPSSIPSFSITIK